MPALILFLCLLEKLGAGISGVAAEFYLFFCKVIKLRQVPAECTGDASKAGCLTPTEKWHYRPEKMFSCSVWDCSFNFQQGPQMLDIEVQNFIT